MTDDLKDEKDLWASVTSTITPLKKTEKVSKTPTKTSMIVKRRYSSSFFQDPDRNSAPHHTHLVATFVLERYFKKKPIQRSIDLHGFTVQQAQQALRHFFMMAQENKDSYVLVICGKGNSKNVHQDHPAQGILQNYCAYWFESHPNYVICYSIASPNQGGSGAYFVHVRKKKEG